MHLPMFIYLCGILLFGLTTIYFSISEEKLKKKVKLQENSYKQKLYEVSILKNIQERIGYSLDVTHVIDTLTGSLKNLFTFSTASSIIIQEDKLIFTIYIEDKVNSMFIEDVKKSMLASLSSLTDTPLPQTIEEHKTGYVADDMNKSQLASFFHVPLVVNGKVVGLINVSSTTPGLYQESDMTVLYEMTNQALNALSRLKQVISTEESKLLAMIQSLTDGIIMFDRNKQITIINDVAKNLFAIDKSHISVFDVIHAMPKEYPLIDKIDDAIRTGTIVHEKELNLGGGHVVEVFITPVFMSQLTNDFQIQRHAMGTAVLLHDITLEKSLSDLKETFTHSVIHELRSPLTAIKAATELLSSEVTLNTDQKKLVAIITNQSKRMLNDINTLLDAAKMESGHFSVDQKPYSMKGIIDEVITMYTPEAKEQHITLLSQVESHLPDVLIDPIRINQVLINLVSNSIKFIRPPGTISIKAVSSQDMKKVLVTVSDSGIGIPKEKQSLLFSKFSQVGTSGFVPGQQGTGLGLFITKGIIEAHGGKINLVSAPNQGTSISFSLPQAHENETTLQLDHNSQIVHLPN